MAAGPGTDEPGAFRGRKNGCPRMVCQTTVAVVRPRGRAGRTNRLPVPRQFPVNGDFKQIVGELDLRQRQQIARHRQCQKTQKNPSSLAHHNPLSAPLSDHSRRRVKLVGCVETGKVARQASGGPFSAVPQGAEFGLASPPKSGRTASQGPTDS